MFSIGDVKNLLGMTNFKVLVGTATIAPGSYDFNDGVAQGSTNIDLLNNLTDVKQENEKDSRNFILKAGGAALSVLLLGPFGLLGAIFSFIALGNSHKLCVLITLKSQEQLLVIVNNDVYQQLVAIRMDNNRLNRRS